MELSLVGVLLGDGGLKPYHCRNNGLFWGSRAVFERNHYAGRISCSWGSFLGLGMGGGLKKMTTDDHGVRWWSEEKTHNYKNILWRGWERGFEITLLLSYGVAGGVENVNLMEFMAWEGVRRNRGIEDVSGESFRGCFCREEGTKDVTRFCYGVVGGVWKKHGFLRDMAGVGRRVPRNQRIQNT